MFAIVVKLSISGNIIDHNDLNHKVDDEFSLNKINSRTSFLCKRYHTPPLVRSMRHPPPALVLSSCFAQEAFFG